MYNEECEGQVATIQQPQTLMVKFTKEEENLKSRLEDIKRAKEILKNNPDTEELLNIIMRSERRLL